jgi:enoyl-CoA hydratase/carnithine racemase
MSQREDGKMLVTEKAGCVVCLTMDRPRRRNALGAQAIAQLRAALLQADRDGEVRAIVLTGAPPAFCAGSDLKELGGMSIAQMCEHEADTAEVGRLISGLDKPVIAAVEGYALGGGFILAISCDVVVTARDARWHLPEVANGWLPPWGLQTLAARVGVVRARQLTWGADVIDGAEAHRLGVADVLTGSRESLPAAMALASRLAALPPAAVAGTKQFFKHFATVDAERMDRLASRMFADHCEGDEARQVLSRFAARSDS